MTFDPDKLRKQLLGDTSEETKKTPTDAPKSIPKDLPQPGGKLDPVTGKIETSQSWDIDPWKEPDFVPERDDPAWRPLSETDNISEGIFEPVQPVDPIEPPIPPEPDPGKFVGRELFKIPAKPAGPVKKFEPETVSQKENVVNLRPPVEPVQKSVPTSQSNPIPTDAQLPVIIKPDRFNREPSTVASTSAPSGHGDSKFGQETSKVPSILPGKPATIGNKDPLAFHEHSDDLEKTSADNFAPLRKALSSGNDKPEPDPEPVKPEKDQILPPGSDHKTGKKRVRKIISPDDIKPPSPMTMLVLTGGGISLLGAIIGLAIGQTGMPVIGLGAIGLVLISVFGLVNRLWLKVALSSRSTKYGINVATVVLTFFCIMVFANILSYRYHHRIDLSEAGVNSLSPQTLQILDDINRAGEDIVVTAFIPPTSGYREEVEKLMDLYLYHTNHIKFSFIDPEVQRSFTEEKNIRSSQALLFELGDNRSVQTDIDEPHVTAGLIAVRRMDVRKVAFITGHGEADPYSTDDIAGLSNFREKLELEGYEVGKMTISPSSGIPQETNLIIFAGPRNPIPQSELNAVRNYLDAGGSMACFLEPDDPSGLAAVIHRYGITLVDGVILDDFDNYNNDLKTPKAVLSRNHAITRVFDEALVLNVAGSLRDTSGAYDDIAAETLLKSGLSCWIENNDNTVFDAGSETKGQKELAILTTRRIDPSSSSPVTENMPESQLNESGYEPIEESTEGSIDTGEESVTENLEMESAPDENREFRDSDTEGNPVEQVSDTGITDESVSQVLVVADSSLINNGFSDLSNNLDFALNAVNHMTEVENLIGIRPAIDKQRTLDMTNIQMNVVFAVSVILVPLLIAFAGGMVWWKRRD